ncbi:rhamnulokinase [Patulibacter defluvii]|uniref:rhamnulokinase n=1 Tax=Patulibacter defluvii TaxID=3095358 RepID=UPI002A74B172|nr:rhamnulokinase family protein [Patulibacter sp. DM4]
MSAAAYGAVDLGASTGRVLAGRFDGERLELREAARFPNQPVELPDGRHWDLLHLFVKIRDSLARIPDLVGVGVDTWAVDYGLVDEQGRLLGLPYHYRDQRTAGAVERSFARVPRAAQYAISGTQTLPINTVFQLEAERGGAAFEHAARLAMVPDLLAHWLGAELVNEATNASTTGLLDARSGRWSPELIDGLDLPARLFGPLVEPGTTIGRLAPRLGIGDARIHAVASHDTASAFAAAPIVGPDAAILSSGTWSLLGVEASAPALGDDARAANLTNERGVDGTIRILRNVMGLWLEQELCRAWGLSAAQIQEMAAIADADVPVIDPDDPAFLAPDDLPLRLADACRRSGQQPPTDPGAIARMVYVSLALRYRWVLEQLERVLGRSLATIHVVGGGVRNQLLCQLTADLTGRPVVAGPVEATATGNLLVQLRAVGELASQADARAVSAASFEPLRFEPAITAERADEQYGRFLRALDAAPETAAP